MAHVGIVTPTNSRPLQIAKKKLNNMKMEDMNLEELGAMMQSITADYYNMQWTQKEYLTIMERYMNLMTRYVNQAATQCTHRRLTPNEEVSGELTNLWLDERHDYA